MRAHEWVSLIKRATEPKNADLLDSLAQHLADCEAANTILRANGYGHPGTSILDAAGAVPKAS